MVPALPGRGLGTKCLLLALLVVSSLAACSLSPALPQNQPDTDQTLLLNDHPLAGKIWDVAARQFISKQQLSKRIAESRYLLLGETHDNPLHHQGEAWAITQLQKRQRTAEVAFEMISKQQGQLIASTHYDSVASLIAGLKHINASWEYQRYYGAIFAEALQAGYTLLPANFNRPEIMAIARKGEAELPPEIKTMLDDHALPADQVAASRKEIEGSHCGMINEKMTTAMMLVQRAKDAQMARAISANNSSNSKLDTRVLVAGSGHVRKDRGVPFYLPAPVKENNLLAIAWAEVQEEAVEAEAYAAHWGAQTLPFDVVWFTPRFDRPDPCVQFRQHMMNKK